MQNHRQPDYRHPSDEPGFGAKQDQPVWYMSHPLAPDEHYTYQQNMDHIVHLLRIFWEEGYRVVAPYHTVCLAITDDDMKYRVAGLEADMNMCARMGYVFLTGHRMSRGMYLESQASMTCKSGGIIRNLVGYNDDELRTALRFLENGGQLEEDRPARV